MAHCLCFQADPTIEEFPSLENLALSPTPSPCVSPQHPVSVQSFVMTHHDSFNITISDGKLEMEIPFLYFSSDVFVDTLKVHCYKNNIFFLQERRINRY